MSPIITTVVKTYVEVGWQCDATYIGTFELADEEAEEIYEVINIGKIKAHTPNLRVVNLYGISFVDDSHVELLSSNCIHLESLALNFCLRVKGSTLKVLIQRCKKLRGLLLQHCGMTLSLSKTFTTSCSPKL